MERPQREAVLIVASQGGMPDVRSSFGRSWTQLFQAGEYYIDLSLHPSYEAAVLRGQVLLPGAEAAIPEGNVHLYDPVRKRLAAVPLGGSGTFSLQLRRDQRYQIRFELETEDLWVRDLVVD